MHNTCKTTHFNKFIQYAQYVCVNVHVPCMHRFFVYVHVFIIIYIIIITIKHVNTQIPKIAFWNLSYSFMLIYMQFSSILTRQ